MSTLLEQREFIVDGQYRIYPNDSIYNFTHRSPLTRGKQLLSLQKIIIPWVWSNQRKFVNDFISIDVRLNLVPYVNLEFYLPPSNVFLSSSAMVTRLNTHINSRIQALLTAKGYAGLPIRIYFSWTSTPGNSPLTAIIEQVTAWGGETKQTVGDTSGGRILAIRGNLAELLGLTSILDGVSQVGVDDYGHSYNGNSIIPNVVPKQLLVRSGTLTKYLGINSSLYSDVICAIPLGFETPNSFINYNCRIYFPIHPSANEDLDFYFTDDWGPIDTTAENFVHSSNTYNPNAPILYFMLQGIHDYDKVVDQL